MSDTKISKLIIIIIIACYQSSESHCTIILRIYSDIVFNIILSFEFIVLLVLLLLLYRGGICYYYYYYRQREKSSNKSSCFTVDLFALTTNKYKRI